MTPKIIHFIWVGGAPKPPIVLQCIESWRRFCPGWEIREWGDDLVRQIGNRYVQEAYAHKKWAFVADWLRLYVLHKYGGFYLDSDMEILRPIDCFLTNRLTMGFVDRAGKVLYNGGFIGCVPNDSVIAGLLSMYENLSFVLPNGELDQTPNTVRMVQYFARTLGVAPKTAYETLDLGEDRFIYAHDWFLSRTGYTFHHYCASWLDDWVRKPWLSLGGYKLVRFKRRREADSSTPTLQPNERAVFSMRLSARKKLILLRGKDC